MEANAGFSRFVCLNTEPIQVTLLKLLKKKPHIFEHRDFPLIQELTPPRPIEKWMTGSEGTHRFTPTMFSVNVAQEGGTSA